MGAFIGYRFHAVVAALVMGMPSLAIGWSHKHREMTDMLSHPTSIMLQALQRD